MGTSSQPPPAQPSPSPVAVGAALRSRYTWAPHGSARRSEAYVRELADKWGVEVPDDVRLIFREGLVPPDAYATYGAFFSSKKHRWDDLLVHDKIPLRIDPRVLESDEAIVAVLAHEIHEIESLRALFEERELIPGSELIALVRPDRPGNLHDEAWDVADRLVQKMRDMS